MQLLRLGRAVAVAAEDLVGVDAAPEDLRGEIASEIDGAVRACLLRVRDDDLAEVVVALQGAECQHEDLDEVREVAVAVERLEVVGQRVVVALRDRAERVGPHRPLEMDVQLDLRERMLRRRHAP